jgi:hypothetical protein
MLSVECMIERWTRTQRSCYQLSSKQAFPRTLSILHNTESSSPLSGLSVLCREKMIHVHRWVTFRTASQRQLESLARTRCTPSPIRVEAEVYVFLVVHQTWFPPLNSIDDHMSTIPRVFCFPVHLFTTAISIRARERFGWQNSRKSVREISTDHLHKYTDVGRPLPTALPFIANFIAGAIAGISEIVTFYPLGEPCSPNKCHDIHLCALRQMS